MVSREGQWCFGVFQVAQAPESAISLFSVMYIDILIVIESANQSQKPYQVVDKNCISMLEGW